MHESSIGTYMYVYVHSVPGHKSHKIVLLDVVNPVWVMHYAKRSWKLY